MAMAALFALPASAKSSGIEINGSIELDSVLRSNVGDYDSDVDDAGRAYLEADITLGFTAELSSNVTAVVELAQDVSANKFGVGTAGSNGIEVEKAYLKFDEFFIQNLSATWGVQPVVYDLRGDGNSFLLDVEEALDAEAIGYSLTWNADPFFVDIFTSTIVEDVTVANNDAWLWGAVVDWIYEEENLVTVKLLRLDDNSGTLIGGGEANIWTFAGGADWFFLDKALEVYGEFAVNFGETADNVDAEGMAFYLGGEYTLDNEYKPFVGASFWFFTGTDASDAGATEAFLALSDIDESLIFEENDHGQGAGVGAANYYAFRIVGGIEPTEDTALEARFHLFSATEDNGGEDGLGIEFDVLGSYTYSEDVTFDLGIGFLAPGDGMVDQRGAAGDDSAFLVKLGTSVDF